MSRRNLMGLLIAVAIAGLAVAGARWFAGSQTGQEFLTQYPGASTLPAGTPEGFSWWRKWQHFFNIFLIVLIIRSGWMVHTQTRPEAYWTRDNTKLITTKSQPTKMSLYLWLHLTLDALWVLNGLAFVIALFSTGQWARIVPTSWDVIPQALSAGLQYLSFDWPVDHAWVNYNGLQLLAYFVTVFVAAPLAILTGIRISPVWSPKWTISTWYPIQLARAIHLPVMYYFTAFIIVHVSLVLTTGMRRNLNLMFASQPEGSSSWWGFAGFMIALLIIAVGWILARPIFMSSLARLTGRVTQR